MKELTIKITDESKLAFLLELLSQLDFIEFETKFFNKRGATDAGQNKDKQEPSSPTFSWAGGLKGMDEGLSSVEWQHKINELRTENALRPTD
ncbi:MAG: hypothetical protein H6577_27215 [Lewinellaceae bacterium]|nr:hypothetical protein [Saprospiraceae bacterium]MCB9341834.1 hypothetical protein [Lewinellaceae bacterium]